MPIYLVQGFFFQEDMWLSEVFRAESEGGVTVAVNQASYVSIYVFRRN